MDAITIADSDLSQALAWFEDLVSRWNGGPWTWDGRFGCPISVVREPDLDEALGLVRSLTPFEFGSADRLRMPDELSAIVARSGGLRPGQRAFCDRLRDGSMRYCLWWPWGDGTTASLRIGIIR